MELNSETHTGDTIPTLMETVDEVLAYHDREPFLSTFGDFAKEMFGKPFIVPPTAVAEMEEEIGTSL